MDLKPREGTRTEWFGVLCALILVCLWVPASNASSQTSTTNPASSKAATSRATSTKKKHRTAVAHASTKSTVATSHKVSIKGKRSSRRRVRGQQKIDSERVQAIQSALIREHYLNGEATGTWNLASEDAMRRYQSDHGWQSKTVPDSRALIQLGLGPSKDRLLNPESAMITGPTGPRSAKLSTESHSPKPGAVGKSPTAEPIPATTIPADPVSPQ